jgi:ribonuclease HI
METVHVYTDGSVIGNPGPGGWSAILMARSSARIIGGYAKRTTNNRMEVKALIGALRILKYPCHVILYTDSKYLIYGLRRLFRGGMLTSNVDMWERLKSLLYTHALEIMKVQAHAGDELNNLVDVYAKFCAGKQINIDKFLENSNDLITSAVVFQ